MTTPIVPTSPASTAEAREVFLGIRIPLPNGKTFVCRKALLFRDGLRWMELAEQFTSGEKPYSQTLKTIVAELPTLEPEDLSVLDTLTPGEVIDYVIYSFFSHRRWRPSWLQQLIDEALKQAPPASNGT